MTRQEGSHRSLMPDKRYLPLEGLPLTHGQVRALETYARHPDYRETREILGISQPALRHRMSKAYQKLGAHGAVDAYRKLGWLRPPPYDRRPS